MLVLDKPGVLQGRLISSSERQRLLCGSHLSRCESCTSRHKIHCCALPLLHPWAEMCALVRPTPLAEGASVSLTSPQKILLEWLSSMLFVFPMGVVPYYFWLTWRASNPDGPFHRREVPEPRVVLHGVDVSESALMKNPEVLRAVEFAARAHQGQFRKTGEPYVSHCLETALIFEELLSPSIENARAEPAFMAAVLHDVLDDTDTAMEDLCAEFEEPVPRLVQQVSELSSLIQLLRRHKRLNDGMTSTDTKWSEQNSRRLKSTILKKMQEPLVLLIKLADRLHNMRTVFALKPEKRRSVAQETRGLFCTLAERLGLFSLKAELEDLCFAVLEPMEFSRAHYDIEMLWCPPVNEEPTSTCEDLIKNVSGPVPKPELFGVADVPVPAPLCNRCAVDASLSEEKNIVPDERGWDPYVWGGRPGRLNNFKLHLGCSCALSGEVLTNEQCEELISWVLPFRAVNFRWSGPSDAMGFGQNFLREQTEKILHEVAMGSFGAGFHIEVSGRVKSLYSANEKMDNKNLTRVSDVLDVLALRIVVNDEGQDHRAVELCYILLSTVERLWKPVHQELDDYIANPKDSGYQSLHTSVIGPGGVPFEIQIRTSSMHQAAEYGSAAHWNYKENPNISSPRGNETCKLCKIGQPVLRIQSGRYLDGVVIQCDKGGRHVLVAVHLDGQFPRLPGSRAAPKEEYEKLLEYVQERGWFHPGHGDYFVVLERYVLCVDGAHHRIDHYGQKEGKTFVRPINDPDVLVPIGEKDNGSKAMPFGVSGPGDEGLADMSHIQRMRLGLDYYNDVASGVDLAPLEDEKVFVLLWPEAKITCFPKGTTAAEVLASKGWIEIGDGQPRGTPLLVNVNNKLVPEETVLQDGDFMVTGREKIKI